MCTRGSSRKQSSLSVPSDCKGLSQGPSVEKSLSTTALVAGLPREPGYSGLGRGGHLILGKGWQGLTVQLSAGICCSGRGSTMRKRKSRPKGKRALLLSLAGCQALHTNGQLPKAPGYSLIPCSWSKTRVGGHALPSPVSLPPPHAPQPHCRFSPSCGHLREGKPSSGTVIQLTVISLRTRPPQETSRPVPIVRGF